ncbi:YdaS family helix-turn-helix protein [Bradyrhizobium sp. 930_D9_N1_4]|uniref:YdaS family helix-turn-helix protein n=1 Tax=Bradyrhizobium sp. 930_D9_N1_4 TaxID=3240374 RepID=UPI003F894829
MGDNLIERAIKLAGGSEAKLANETGLSQPLINKARRTGRAGPKLALAIHEFTKGVIPASALRPDLWAPPSATSDDTLVPNVAGVD